MMPIPQQIHDPMRHEEIVADPWDADFVQREIEYIAADFEVASLPSGGWPTHPLDDETRSPKWALYSGAAGAVVSLRILRNAGYSVRDWSPVLQKIHAAYLLNPDYGHETGLQLGEIGILAPAFLANPGDQRTGERLIECMRQTVDHPAREVTSGGTGMMHAALTLFRKTGNEIWKDLYCEAAHSLWNSWQQDAETGQWMWRSHIFKVVRSYYGACHGVAGNVQALLRGIEFLPAEWADTMIERAASTLLHGSVRQASEINWPLSAETDPVGMKRLMQWCHGAPGVATALASVGESGSENARTLGALINDAAEFVWKAGPLVKGPGICHGTAGNGYTFIALYRRTGSPHWLERARRFAMHAIYQSRHAREIHGQRRYTLWTGDGGLAVYLHHCLKPETSAFPGLEEF